MKKLKLFVLLFCMFATNAYSASVVATISGHPITDTDVTARVKLMTLQGKSSTDNRRVALQHIIDDYIKLEYAKNFDAVPEDKIVKAEVDKMKLPDLSTTEREMAINAMRAEIAWQIVVARTVLPTITVSDDDVKSERDALARDHGLPIEMTIVRLVDIPQDVAKKLTKPKSCDDAVDMAEKLGGAPQKFTALQYELSADIRARVANLPKLTWSGVQDGSVLLVCSTKKTAEYGKTDEIIKQNTMYKQALFMADQQLKQLRRKAVIVINDDRYKL